MRQKGKGYLILFQISCISMRAEQSGRLFEVLPKGTPAARSTLLPRLGTHSSLAEAAEPPPGLRHLSVSKGFHPAQPKPQPVRLLRAHRTRLACRAAGNMSAAVK